LGLEKISLINGKMRCFFPQDPLAAVYQSEAFISLMGFVAQHAQKFNAKQTDKAFIVEALGVNTVFEALYVLGEWDEFRKG
jgi:transcription-repair coupling factor (superfamily II helicase)